MDGVHGVLGRIAFASGLVGALMIAVSGPIAQIGLIDHRSALLVFVIGLIACLVALVAALVWGLLRLARGHGPRWGRALAGFVIAGVAAAYPLAMLQKAASVPVIHDITTDIVEPPAFVALAGHRDGAENPDEYPGLEVAMEQTKAYPTIKPFVTAMPPPALFVEARTTAEAMGWEIVSASEADGRIEATDTSAFFGFKDDIVIRIREEGEGSRLDMRSKSRIGQSDIGANAARIEKFLAELKT